jgi:hypothetical protein
MEEVSNGQSWNKKKIIIAFFLLAILIIGGYFLKTRILGESSPQVKESVKGATIEEITSKPEPKVNVQEIVREKINNIRQEVSGLNILEVASSSPQVQKILNDIKSLEQYPANQIKEICKKVCGL